MVRTLTFLLGLDMVVAWMTIQGAYTYLGMVWHGVAGEALPPGSVEAHARHWLVLRGVHVATWLGVGALIVAWRRPRSRARDAPGSRPTERKPLARTVLVLAVAAVVAHAVAAVLAADPLRPFDLGGSLQLLTLGALLEMAAAAGAIVLVRRLSVSPEDRRPARPAGPSTCP